MHSAVPADTAKPETAKPDTAKQSRTLRGRLFLDHPASVGESYSGHARTALSFGARMIAGGAACVLHALIPALCPRTASGAVERLHRQMHSRRPARGENGAEVWIEYHI